MLLNTFISNNFAGGGAGLSCPDDSSPDISVEGLSNDNEFQSLDTDTFYIGQGAYTDATTRTICKIGFYVGGIHGTISSLHYEVKIWPMSGNNLGTLLTDGTSDAITGIASTGWKMFSWSGSKPVMTGGVAHAITISTQEAADGVNYAIVWLDNPDQISGNPMRWNTAFNLDGDLGNTSDVNIRIYWYD